MLNVSLQMPRSSNMMVNIMAWFVKIAWIVFMLISINNCEHCNGLTDGTCDFDTVDMNSNNLVSFEELIHFISKNRNLDKESLIKYILVYGKSFYQNDFNGDGQLSRFEWARGGEVIAVISRLISGKSIIIK